MRCNHLPFLTALCLSQLGCADVLFERDPYALRGLDIVYSSQENMTFLVWRLREQVDPSRVRFELWQEGDYRPITLEDAPYAAAPYKCGAYYLCFQYQLSGEVSWPDGVLPVRSIHDELGVYGGSVPEYRRALRTFSAQPVALNRNEFIDPGRYDWFNVEGVPLERSYEYQLVASSADHNKGIPDEVCAAPVAGAWTTFDKLIAPQSGWVESPRCLVVRPQRTDGRSAEAQVVRLMPPSAELESEVQEYLPSERTPPPVYLYLTDLLIRSEERCKRAQREIERVIDTQMSQRAPGARRLGTFFPQDTVTGETRDGCQQASAQDYPVNQMLAVIKVEVERLAPQEVRVVVIYINNADLPPSPRVLTQLLELGWGIQSIPGARLYTLAIGSDSLLGLAAEGGFEWNERIGWRPIDDQTFMDDLTAWGQATLPFRTMDHTINTAVKIPRPQRSRREPLAFKLCASSDDVVGYQLGEMGRRVQAGFVFYPWPPQDVPRYYVAREPQILIPNKAYKRVKTTVTIEVCERFCNMPFRTAVGEIVQSWERDRRCLLAEAR